ncbi:HtaA domain-containing protein [Rothia nasimurium]|uniref:HtaA domain-containing protein n=1 Tax=Rothia nasimurium TaxID=85336 RepID=UPI003A0FEFDA
MEWQAKPGQTFDPENPGKLHFTGHVHWSKYDGYLDVHFKNLTIDFATKQLLVDASTANTMAGTGPASATQEAIADLPDLAWEIRGNTLLVYSHAPVITQLQSASSASTPATCTFCCHLRNLYRRPPGA